MLIVFTTHCQEIRCNERFRCKSDALQCQPRTDVENAKTGTTLAPFDVDLPCTSMEVSRATPINYLLQCLSHGKPLRPLLPMRSSIRRLAFTPDPSPASRTPLRNLRQMLRLPPQGIRLPHSTHSQTLQHSLELPRNHDLPKDPVPTRTLRQ